MKHIMKTIRCEGLKVTVTEKKKRLRFSFDEKPSKEICQIMKIKQLNNYTYGKDYKNE